MQYKCRVTLQHLACYIALLCQIRIIRFKFDDRGVQFQLLYMVSGNHLLDLTFVILHSLVAQTLNNTWTATYTNTEAEVNL